MQSGTVLLQNLCYWEQHYDAPAKSLFSDARSQKRAISSVYPTNIKEL